MQASLLSHLNGVRAFFNSPTNSEMTSLGKEGTVHLESNHKSLNRSLWEYFQLLSEFLHSPQEKIPFEMQGTVVINSTVLQSWAAPLHLFGVGTEEKQEDCVSAVTHQRILRR